MAHKFVHEEEMAREAAKDSMTCKILLQHKSSEEAIATDSCPRNER